MNSGLLRRIPYATEQGTVYGKQGTLVQEHGILEFALRAKPLPLASQVDAADGPLSWRLGDVGSAVPRRVVLLLGALIEAGICDGFKMITDVAAPRSIAPRPKSEDAFRSASLHPR
jgi:hypothetical protein